MNLADQLRGKSRAALIKKFAALLPESAREAYVTEARTTGTYLQLCRFTERSAEKNGLDLRYGDLTALHDEELHWYDI